MGFLWLGWFFEAGVVLLGVSGASCTPLFTYLGMGMFLFSRVSCDFCGSFLFRLLFGLVSISMFFVWGCSTGAVSVAAFTLLGYWCLL